MGLIQPGLTEFFVPEPVERPPSLGKARERFAPSASFHRSRRHQHTHLLGSTRAKGAEGTRLMREASNAQASGFSVRQPSPSERNPSRRCAAVEAIASAMRA